MTNVAMGLRQIFPKQTKTIFFMIPPNSLFGLPNLAELLAFHYGKPAYYYYYNKNVTER